MAATTVDGLVARLRARQGAAVGAEGGHRSLDKRTQLPHPDNHWRVAVYPEVGEAVVCLVPRQREPSSEPSSLPDDERARRNHQRATRRATVESRRYIVGNRLRYMWVLTFAQGLMGAEGRAECMRTVAEFAERLRAKEGALPYWYSPELHPGGHGWHVNFFVGRRLKHSDVAELWGHGYVFVKDWAKDSRVKTLNLGLLDAIRLGAQYGCKYASKDWSDQVIVGGAHRYEVAQGFAPTLVVLEAASAWAGVEAAQQLFGGRPHDSIWRSSDVEDWDGPPVCILTWRTLPGSGGLDGL